MKRFLFVLLILFSIPILHAQKDTTFYHHEVKASISDALLSDFWIANPNNYYKKNVSLYFNIAFSYFYRPVKWFWVGGNFISYFGDKMEYKWKEYDINGREKLFLESKRKYCAVIAPEIRFSYLNRKHTILYSALSAGICIENGYDSRYDKYPEFHSFFQVTLFGVSGSFGKKGRVFLGGELGIGNKGFFIFQGGYRF